MNLGIYGGTFDPVHLGHLLLAETAREHCRLDEIRFLPANRSPFKGTAEVTKGKVRVEMLELATAGFREFTVDRREIKRGGLSYTVDTLQEFADEFPDANLFFLMGADSLTDLPTWREPERIAALAKIVAVNRGHDAAGKLAADIAALPEELKNSVITVQMPGVEMSASQLRERVAEKRSIRFLTPRPIERYIQEKKLYLPSESGSAS